jgi:hypothetical protein
MTTRLTAALLSTIMASGLGFGVAAGCGGKESSSAPEVVPGAPAGDVREVTGTVTAKRGDEPARPLAVGDVVAGDDVIETSAGSSIVIELRHNGVKWSLAAGHAKKLGDSAAWKAPRKDGAGGATGERSTAAGRHAEREAAGTAVSAEAAGSGAAETAAAPPPPGAVPAPAPAPAADPAPPAEEPAEEPDEAEKRAPREKRPADAPKSDNMARKSGGGGGDAHDLETLLQGGGSTGGGATAKKAAKVKATAKLTAPSSADAGNALGDRLGAFRNCWQHAVEQHPSSGGSIALTLKVGADGKVTDVTTRVEGEVGGAEACVAAQARRVTFPAGAATEVTATLVLGIE